jgi:hypothetical protein
VGRTPPPPPRGRYLLFRGAWGIMGKLSKFFIILENVTDLLYKIVQWRYISNFISDLWFSFDSPTYLDKCCYLTKAGVILVLKIKTKISVLYIYTYIRTYILVYTHTHRDKDRKGLPL